MLTSKILEWDAEAPDHLIGNHTEGVEHSLSIHLGMTSRSLSVPGANHLASLQAPTRESLSAAVGEGDFLRITLRMTGTINITEEIRLVVT